MAPCLSDEWGGGEEYAAGVPGVNRATGTPWSLSPRIPRSTLQGGRGHKEKGIARAISHSAPSSHVRSRLSACLCGKKAGAVSILFHLHHELCPTDMRSHRINALPPPTQSQQQEPQESGHGNMRDFRGQTKAPGRGQQGKEQEARTAISLLCDLEQVTDSASLFSPVCQIEIIKAVLKFE